jgi:heptaprenyl diphosphate synthase
VRPATQKIARFGLLTALALVLGLLDRAIPITAILGGAAPGIKLGLANTVLLYAVYLMDWKSCVLLMLTKVVLSGFLFGSLTAILYSLSGGILSLTVMLLIRNRPDRGALIAALAALAADIYLLIRTPQPKGQRLWIIILIALAFLACTAVYAAVRKGRIRGVTGTSLAGAVAHNIGQVIMACAVLRSPMLLTTYLPILAGIGAAVGCLTGIVTERVLKALRIKVNTEFRMTTTQSQGEEN